MSMAMMYQMMMVWLRWRAVAFAALMALPVLGAAVLGAAVTLRPACGCDGPPIRPPTATATASATPIPTATPTPAVAGGPQVPFEALAGAPLAPGELPDGVTAAAPPENHRFGPSDPRDGSYEGVLVRNHAIGRVSQRYMGIGKGPYTHLDYIVFPTAADAARAFDEANHQGAGAPTDALGVPATCHLPSPPRSNPPIAGGWTGGCLALVGNVLVDVGGISPDPDRAMTLTRAGIDHVTRAAATR